jgi:hypothetical protein
MGLFPIDGHASMPKMPINLSFFTFSDELSPALDTIHVSIESLVIRCVTNYWVPCLLAVGHFIGLQSLEMHCTVPGSTETSKRAYVTLPAIPSRPDYGVHCSKLPKSGFCKPPSPFATSDNYRRLLKLAKSCNHIPVGISRIYKTLRPFAKLVE